MAQDLIRYESITPYSPSPTSFDILLIYTSKDLTLNARGISRLV